MKQDKTQLPKQLEAGGVCIQALDWSELNVARIRFPKGADATPLLVGLPQDLCQCPHWGLVLRGSIHVRYAAATRRSSARARCTTGRLVTPCGWTRTTRRSSSARAGPWDR